MKKYLLTSLLAVFAVSSANAAVGFDPYVTVRGGYDIQTNMSVDSFTMESIELKGDRLEAVLGNDLEWETSGFMVGGAVGATFFTSDYFNARAELEYIYNGLQTDDAEPLEIFNHTALFNLAGDIKTGTPITPYVTAGIGYGWTNVSDGNMDLTGGTGMAWQVGAGIAYNVTDAFAIDLGYRYLNNGTINFENPFADSGDPILDTTFDNKEHSMDIAVDGSHQVYLGLRYTF